MEIDLTWSHRRKLSLLRPLTVQWKDAVCPALTSTPFIVRKWGVFTMKGWNRTRVSESRHDGFWPWKKIYIPPEPGASSALLLAHLKVFKQNFILNQTSERKKERSKWIVLFVLPPHAPLCRSPASHFKEQSTLIHKVDTRGWSGASNNNHPNFLRLKLHRINHSWIFFFSLPQKHYSYSSCAHYWHAPCPG